MTLAQTPVVDPDVDTGVDPRSDARDGARAMLPILLAYAPFGLLVGAHVAASDNPAAAWLGTWLIYGGAAQLAVLDVLGQDSGWITAALVGLLVNLRLAAYATAMVPRWRTASMRRRTAAALVLTDPPWAQSRTRVRGVQAYYFGAALTMLVVWPTLVTVGVFLGGHLEEYAVTMLLLPLTLGAIVMPQLRQSTTAVAVTAAAVCAVVTLPLAAGPALALIGLVGGLAGVVAERLS